MALFSLEHPSFTTGVTVGLTIGGLIILAIGAKVLLTVAHAHARRTKRVQLAERLANAQMPESPEFEALAKALKEWDDQHAYYSFPTHHHCPAYPTIIAMGTPIVPLLLRELHRDYRMWMFSALREITKTSPIPEEHSGRLSEMKDDWIRWGEENGYLPAK